MFRGFRDVRFTEVSEKVPYSVYTQIPKEIGETYEKYPDPPKEIGESYTRPARIPREIGEEKAAYVTMQIPKEI